jgi:hypothetical protein
MKTSNTAAWILGVVVVIALLWWAAARHGNSLMPGGDLNATTTTSTSSDSDSATGTGTGATGSTSGSGTGTGSTNLGQVYSNSTYNFTISFPKGLHAGNYDNFHELNQNDWRFQASMQYRGTPVVAIPVIEVDHGGVATNQPYPLFYTAQVRVGVSTDTANCYVKNEGYTNQTITNVAIGGVTWKRFDYSDAATMKYIRGSDYRTIHNNKCYVIEQIENGSNYTDPTMKGGYTDAQLKAFYDQTTAIAKTFRFTK